MSASPQRRLRRLLESRGYTLTSTDVFDNELWELEGVEPFILYPNCGARQLDAHYRRIERASRNQKTPEQREFDELERKRREHAQRERELTARKQVQAWGIRKSDIDRIAARVEAEESAHKQTVALMRHRPYQDIRG